MLLRIFFDWPVGQRGGDAYPGDRIHALPFLFFVVLSRPPAPSAWFLVLHDTPPRTARFLFLYFLCRPPPPLSFLCCGSVTPPALHLGGAPARRRGRGRRGHSHSSPPTPRVTPAPLPPAVPRGPRRRPWPDAVGSRAEAPPYPSPPRRPSSPYPSSARALVRHTPRLAATGQRGWWRAEAGWVAPPGQVRKASPPDRGMAGLRRSFS